MNEQMTNKERTKDEQWTKERRRKVNVKTEIKRRLLRGLLLCQS